MRNNGNFEIRFTGPTNFLSSQRTERNEPTIFDEQTYVYLLSLLFIGGYWLCDTVGKFFLLFESSLRSILIENYNSIILAWYCNVNNNYRTFDSN